MEESGDDAAFVTQALFIAARVAAAGTWTCDDFALEIEETLTITTP